MKPFKKEKKVGEQSRTALMRGKLKQMQLSHFRGSWQGCFVKLAANPVSASAGWAFNKGVKRGEGKLNETSGTYTPIIIPMPVSLLFSTQAFLPQRSPPKGKSGRGGGYKWDPGATHCFIESPFTSSHLSAHSFPLPIVVIDSSCKNGTVWCRLRDSFMNPTLFNSITVFPLTCTKA